MSKSEHFEENSHVGYCAIHTSIVIWRQDVLSDPFEDEESFLVGKLLTNKIGSNKVHTLTIAYERIIPGIDLQNFSSPISDLSGNICPVNILGDANFKVGC